MQFTVEQTEAILDLVEQVEAVRNVWPQQQAHEAAGRAELLQCWKDANTALTVYINKCCNVGVPQATYTHVLFINLPYDLAKRLSGLSELKAA